MTAGADQAATGPRDPLREARGHVALIRTRLQMLGLTDEPLAALTRLLGSPHPFRRAFAARELALWSMRQRDPAGWAAARGHIRAALAAAEVPGMRDRLAVLELLACHGLGLGAGSMADFAARTVERGDPDALLALANLQPDLSARLGLINRVLAGFAIAPVALLDGTGLAYDRLTVRHALPRRGDGPLVSVLIAAWNAEATLPVALRALRAQSHARLEILVLDDASTDGTAAVAAHHAAEDPRVRLVRLPMNLGAYGARNHGLDLARGEYVTLMDADDWVHPARIATQVQYLQAHPGVVGCQTQQARATDALEFTRWQGGGELIVASTASLMFRCGPVREALGYWDTVRFGADAELIRRMVARWGEPALAQIASGPLAFLRAQAGSAVADPATGMDGFYFGARKEYFEAQTAFHSRALAADSTVLRYKGDPERRPFAVPLILRERPSQRPRRWVDRVYGGDFRLPDAALQRVAEAIRQARARGTRVGLFQAYDPLLKAKGATAIHPDLRAEIDGDLVEVLVFGERVGCGRLEMTAPGLAGRYWPEVVEEPPPGPRLQGG